MGPLKQWKAMRSNGKQSETKGNNGKQCEAVEAMFANEDMFGVDADIIYEHM